METYHWAQELTSQVHAKWLSVRHLNPLFEAGYQVFYSPPTHNSDLLIIGFNPGGSKCDFDITSASKIPEAHDYFLFDYPLARRMRRLFDSFEQVDMLRNSTKMNILFFRTQNICQWKKINLSLRRELEKFCEEKVLLAVEKIRPKVILFEGLKTYHCWKKISATNTNDKYLTSNGRVIAVQSTCSPNQSPSPKCLGIIHPSGARMSRSDFNSLGLFIKNELDFESGISLKAE